MDVLPWEPSADMKSSFCLKQDARADTLHGTPKPRETLSNPAYYNMLTLHPFLSQGPKPPIR